MSSAPMKKRDFYNRAQGAKTKDDLEGDDSGHDHPPPEGLPADDSFSYTSLESSLECRLYPSASSPGYSAPKGLGSQSSGDYPYSASSSGCHSPIGYGVDVVQDSRYVPPAAYHRPQDLPINYGAMQFSDVSAENVTPWASGATSAAERPSWTPPSQGPPPGDADDGKKKSKKRPQRCRMCANHGIYVEVKGHKWYCPYRDKEHHTCEKCEITRNKQYFMAKQQKITRDQQQHRQQSCAESLSAGAEQGEQLPPPPRPTNTSDFPRMQELIEETAEIIDQEFLRQIDECVRPRAHH